MIGTLRVIPELRFGGIIFFNIAEPNSRSVGVLNCLQTAAVR